MCMRVSEERPCTTSWFHASLHCSQCPLIYRRCVGVIGEPTLGIGRLTGNGDLCGGSWLAVAGKLKGELVVCSQWRHLRDCTKVSHKGQEKCRVLSWA